jgi:hypothetical protein
MKANNLVEAVNIYKCFSNIEKLRIWNLFINPFGGLLIASDVQKVLNLSSGVFNHFREFSESGLISFDIWGKRKAYFFKDSESEDFVKNVFKEINDELLLQDRIEYYKLLKGGYLQISGWSYVIKNGRITLFRSIKKTMVKIHQWNNINDLINILSRAIKHNRINQISELKTKLSEIDWDKFPELEEKARKVLKRIR